MGVREHRADGGAKTGRPLYVRALDEVFSHRANAALFAVGSIMHAFGHAALAFLVGSCIGALGDIGSTALGGRVVACVGLGLAASCVKGVGSVLAALSQARMTGRLAADVRLAVLEAWFHRNCLRDLGHPDQGGRSPLMAPPLRAAPLSETLGALTSGVREIEAGVQVGVFGAVRAFLQLMPLVAGLFVLAPRLALGATLVLLPFVALLQRTRKRYRAALARLRDERDLVLEAADDAVRHVDVWATHGARDTVTRRLLELGHQVAERGARAEAGAALLTSLNEVLGAAALLGVLGAARAGWLGAFRTETLASFAAVFFMAYRPLRDLVEARLAMARARVAEESIARVAGGPGGGEFGERNSEGNLPPSVEGKLAAAPAVGARRASEPRRLPHWPEGSLELEGIVLGRGRLPPLTVRVPYGKIVGIVGPTGAGKTALLRALLGLERLRAGRILYAESRIDPLPPGPFTRPFAWVPQDAPVLADTLEGNIALDGGGETRQVLARLGADALCDVLGEQKLGAKRWELSGGERQWIALARAVKTGLPVLLLDEPTAALDADSQDRVLAALAALRGSRTILFVTHRTAPLEIADQVIELERVLVREAS